MLSLIFTLLNLIFYISLIFVGYKAVILVRKEVGVWAAIILVIGLLSNSSSTYYSSANSNNKIKSNTIKLVNGSAKSNSVVIEDNLLNEINLMVSYGIDETTKQYVSADATSIMTGFIGSTKWLPSQISVNLSKNKKCFEYDVRGTMEWRFFKTTIYTEPKTYKGFIDIK